MKLSTLLNVQPAAGSGVARPVTPRPYCIGTAAGTTTCTTNGLAAWFAISRKAMLVPSFHDRWPLCSTA